VYCRDCFRDRKHEAGAGSSRPPGRARPATRDETPARPAAVAEFVPGGRQEGAVKWFNKAKGFGFIQNDGGEEIFVHVSALSGNAINGLTQGDRVGFDVTIGARGKQAENVTRLG
jgi:CspA family cold shock protein